MSVYNCWVPNVSGCLSFSNIKGTKVPGRAKHPRTYNVLSDDPKAYIYSLQQRNLSDTIYSRYDTAGEFYYLLSAHVDRTADQERLIGNIYTYPIKSLSREELTLIKEFNKCEHDPTEVVQALIQKRIYNQSTVVVEFELDPDGIAELRCDEADSKLSYTFALEAFSFLRDLIHSHKFHRIDDDAIVVPYPAGGNDNLKWIDKTLSNLHKSIVSAYRNSDLENDIINAIGRLHYLESFQLIVAARKWRVHTQINTSTLRNSLESRVGLIKQDGEMKAIFLHIIVPTILTVLALFIGMTQLLQLPCIQGLTFDGQACGKNVFTLAPEVVAIVQWTLDQWLHLALGIVGATLVILFSVHFDLFSRWLTRHMGYGFVWWLQRIFLSIAVGRWYGRFISSAWIAILVLTILYLIYLASHNVLSWPISKN